MINVYINHIIMKYIIYKIVNKENNEIIYIGSTK